MEIFKNTNYDFIGKQKFFIGLSVVLFLAGMISLAVKGGPKYGIDFKGGTVTYLRFANAPNEDTIRKALSAKIPGEVTVQPVIGQNEVMVSTELKSESELEQARKTMLETLYATFQQPGAKPDFHAMGVDALVEKLQQPLQQASVALSGDQLRAVAKDILNYRDTPPRSALIKNFDELSAVPGVTPPMINVMKQELSLAPFAVRGFELVGPKIGEELRRQALYATLLALAGMLIYVGFRFEWVYGAAAVLAVFHDTLITIGLFSIFNKEISLTVIAALLTLVGYSMNDTIVVFDRIRENLKAMRKEDFTSLVNSSINQTLSRTVMASGLTFLTAVALWLFGGQVLNGFSFALVVGILVGTYSSIFVASPLLIWWQNRLEARKSAMGVATAPVTKENIRDTSKDRDAAKDARKKPTSKAAR